VPFKLDVGEDNIYR